MKRIWLTGASSGIGAALAERLLEQGHHVALSARSAEPLERLKQRWPLRVLVLAGDLTDSSQVAAMAQVIAGQWGYLDQLIINAGTCEYLDSNAFEAAMIERVVRANVFSAAYCLEQALPLLRQSQAAHVVAVSSSVTYLPLPRAEAYGASKAALTYLLNALRVDLAHERIAITVVNPGFVDTPLTQKNDFPMPMRWPVERAAQHIIERLERRPLEINFPWPFIALLRLLGVLPRSLQVKIGQRLARSSQGKAP